MGSRGIAPRILNLGTRWIGSWVGYRAGLDPVAKRKIPNPCQKLSPTNKISVFYISVPVIVLVSHPHHRFKRSQCWYY